MKRATVAREKRSALSRDGWTPVTLQIAQDYGHILVSDDAELEFYREWSGPCAHEANGEGDDHPMCDQCTARKWMLGGTGGGR